MKHLWEVEHPYYAASDYENYYDSWEEFIEEWGDCSFDYNLVYRVDWLEGKDNELPEYNGNPFEKYAEVKVGILMQRKGIMTVQTVKVSRSDEPDIIEFMKERFDYLKEMWEPIS
jgi:hypothetical protein